MTPYMQLMAARRELRRQTKRATAAAIESQLRAEVFRSQVRVYQQEASASADIFAALASAALSRPTPPTTLN